MVPISLQDCEKILLRKFKHNGYKIVEFQLEKSANQRVECKWDNYCLKIVLDGLGGTQTVRFILKTPAKKKEAIMSLSIQQCEPLRKEIFLHELFQEYRTNLHNWDTDVLLKLFLANDRFIVIEDASETEFKLCDSEFFDDLHIKSALATIAKFHSASLIYEETMKKKTGKSNTLLQDFEDSIRCTETMETVNRFYEVAHSGLLQALSLVPLRKMSRADFERKLAKVFDEMFVLVSSSKQYRNVLNHGGLNNNTILFWNQDHAPTKCKLINFEFLSYTPPAKDVLSFLLSVTDFSARKQCWHEYLEYYYSILTSELRDSDVECEQILSWDEFETTCKYLLPFVKLKVAYSKILRVAGVEYVENVYQNEEMFTKTLFKDRITLALQTDNKYIETIKHITEDLEYTLFNDLVTIEDCYKIMENMLGTKEYDIIDYDLIPYDTRCGYLGDHYNMDINFKTPFVQDNIKVFVKALPEVPAQRDFAIESGASLKEHRMFTKFIPLLKQYNVHAFENNVPMCYMSRRDDVAILEDLCVKGYVKRDQRNGLDYEEVVVGVRALAKFHAAFIILEEKVTDSTGHAWRLSDDFHLELVEIFYSDRDLAARARNSSKTGVVASADVFYENRKISAEMFLKHAHNGIDRQLIMVTSSKKFRNTICHGDIWVNNMMFKYEEGHPVNCMLVDFQSYRYCPPAHDLLLLIYLTTNRKFRATYLDEILNIYYAEMSSAFELHGLIMDNIISRNEFDESCEFYMESVLCQTITHYQIIMLSTEIVDEILSDPEYVSRIFYEDKRTFMKEVFEKDPIFKERSRECFLDLIEYFEKTYV